MKDNLFIISFALCCLGLVVCLFGLIFVHSLLFLFGLPVCGMFALFTGSKAIDLLYKING